VCGLAAALWLAVLTGCGTDDDAGGRAVTVRSGERVEITGRDYSFDPKAVTVEGARAAPVEMVLENRGTLAHNLTIVRDDEELGGSPTVTANKRGSLKISLEPGEYKLVCTVDGHEERGMTGTLTAK
jgi:uncharacterized cupredoxin-like copper-binding protein